ncbi:MAG TPA: hypothetical protein VHG69_06365 [Thermoleophilaceae bacterium]|nr:hypothetical protein [Thermoleophilaceae bacterium]
MVQRSLRRFTLGSTCLLLAIAFAMPASALAISGTSLSGDAAQRAYPIPPAGGEVETLDTGSGAPAPTDGESPTGNQAPTAPAAQIQGAEASDEGSRLPFTGYIAGLVLLAGVAMLFGGRVMRRLSFG